MAEAAKQSFSSFFNEGMESLAKTAFPQLSKFMDFKTQDARNDNTKASDSASETEQTLTPNARNSSKNAINNELVIESLSSIDERLKVQSIVLVSQLEQQNITNQLLARLTVSGIGGGGGSGNGNGQNNQVPDHIPGAKSIANWIKTGGEAVLGFLGLTAGELAAGVTAAFATGGINARVGSNVTRMAREEQAQEDAGAIAGDILGGGSGKGDPKMLAERNAKIKDLQDELARIDAKLKKDEESPEQKTGLLAAQVQLQQQLLDLQKQRTQEQQQQTAPTPNYGPWHYGGTPTGPIISDPAGVPTSVRPMSSGMPPLHNGGAYAPTEVPSGQTPWSIVHGGGAGAPAGGGSNISHPAGPGGFRANGGGRMSPDSIDKGIKLRDHLMKTYGMSKEQATGFAGTLMYESGNFHSLQEQNPVGGGQGGWGWAQWTNSGDHRRDEFMANARENNLDPKSDEAQISMIDRELKGKYAKALEAIKKTSTVEDASRVTLEKYEGMPETAAIYARGGKPATRQHQQRSVDLWDAAAKRERGGQAGPDETFTPPKDTSEVLDHIQKARDKGLINGDECVALCAGAVGVRLDAAHGTGSNVHGWRRGEPVMGSKLRPGTAVATFFDRSGKPSPNGLYADGSATGGDPGKQLDHAGSIIGYDADGKGFTLADQWGAHGGRRGSEGTHITHARVGGIDPRTGLYNRELDPTSYSAVKTEDGQYLGGKNSPMALHDETGMPHRPASLGSLKGIINPPHRPTSASAIMHGRRPEEGRNTAADALDMQQYKKDFDAYSENQRENNRGNAFHHTDTSKTVAHALVMSSHENALKESLRAHHSPVVQQFNSEHNGMPDLSVNTKSGRLSDKDVGSANPPASRLKELFVSSENTKGF